MKRVGRFFDIMPVGRIRFRGKLLRRDRGSCVIRCRNLWGFVRRLFLGLWFFLFLFFYFSFFRFFVSLGGRGGVKGKRGTKTDSNFLKKK